MPKTNPIGSAPPTKSRPSAPAVPTGTVESQNAIRSRRSEAVSPERIHSAGPHPSVMPLEMPLVLAQPRILESRLADETITERLKVM
jgi:hypothetical protein